MSHSNTTAPDSVSPLSIAGRHLSSRLVVGTGKYEDHDVMQRAKHRPCTLSKNRLVLFKVYLWVCKVPIFLYKTLSIVPETRVAGVYLIQLAPICLRRLAWQSALRGNCRWHHAARRLHHSFQRPSGWGNSAL